MDQRSTPGQLRNRKRNHLPHFDVEESLYFVTWCLADALSPAFFKGQETERSRLLAELQSRHGTIRPVDVAWVRKTLLRRLFAELDSGRGSASLSRSQIAEVVERAILHFDGDRYRIYAYSVMPSHVHVVFRASPGWPWWKIVGGWKSFTSKEANKILGRSGRFWQDDNFDRVIRDRGHLERAINYVLDNPSKGGLADSRFTRQLAVASFEEVK